MDTNRLTAIIRSVSGLPSRRECCAVSSGPVSDSAPSGWKLWGPSTNTTNSTRRDSRRYHLRTSTPSLTPCPDLHPEVPPQGVW